MFFFLEIVVLWDLVGEFLGDRGGIVERLCEECGWGFGVDFGFRLFLLCFRLGGVGRGGSCY